MKIIFLIVALCVASTLAISDKGKDKSGIDHCLQTVGWTHEQFKKQCRSGPPEVELKDTPFEKLLECIFKSSGIVKLEEVEDEEDGMIFEPVVHPNKATSLVSKPLATKFEGLLEKCADEATEMAGCILSASVYLNKCLFDKNKELATETCLAMI